MAYLINRIYQTNQDVFGVDQTFKLSSDVKKVEVSKATGTLPGGSVTVDKTSISNPSSKVTSYWATGGPSTVSFDFGIGGSDANYSNYWKKIAPKTTKTTTTPTNTNSNSSTTEKKKDDEDADKEETNDNENNND